MPFLSAWIESLAETLVSLALPVDASEEREMANQGYVGWVKSGAKWTPVKASPSQDVCQGAALARARGGRIVVLPEGIEPATDDGCPVLTVGDSRPESFDPPRLNRYRVSRKFMAA